MATVWQVEVWQGDAVARCWTRSREKGERLLTLAAAAVKRSDKRAGVVWGLDSGTVQAVERSDARGPSGIRSGEELWRRG